MASTDTLTMGVDQYILVTMDGPGILRVTLAFTDTLTMGVDQYILVTVDGPGIPE